MYINGVNAPYEPLIAEIEAAIAPFRSNDTHVWERAAPTLEDVFIHLIFDGRSTEPGSAPDLLLSLEGRMNKIGLGQLATGMGRGIALDHRVHAVARVEHPAGEALFEREVVDEGAEPDTLDDAGDVE